MKYINFIIKFFKNLLDKSILDKNKMDNIISKLNMELFYGAIGNEIYYMDEMLQKPLLTIKLYTNDIKLFYNEQRIEMIKNMSLSNINRKELIYLYEKVEDYILNKIEIQNTLEKENLLRFIGLNEEQFSFLTENCKSINKIKKV